MKSKETAQQELEIRQVESIRDSRQSIESYILTSPSRDIKERHFVSSGFSVIVEHFNVSAPAVRHLALVLRDTRSDDRGATTRDVHFASTSSV